MTYAASRRTKRSSMATAVDLLDLFPSASTSGARTVCVSAASLAVLGPQLPASCVLHLALNHLKHSGGGSDDGGDELHGSPGLSERAWGKLPERSGFEEKVAGSDSDGEASDDRHSARTHFSWTPRHGGATEAALRRVLVLTPSRNTLRRQLADQFDDSLAGGRLDPIDLALLDRIDLRCALHLARRPGPTSETHVCRLAFAATRQLSPDFGAPFLFPLDGAPCRHSHCCRSPDGDQCPAPGRPELDPARADPRHPP